MVLRPPLLLLLLLQQQQLLFQLQLVLGCGVGTARLAASWQHAWVEARAQQGVHQWARQARLPSRDGQQHDGGRGGGSACRVQTRQAVLLRLPLLLLLVVLLRPQGGLGGQLVNAHSTLTHSPLG
jgi:hypothetical protein